MAGTHLVRWGVKFLNKGHGVDNHLNVDINGVACFATKLETDQLLFICSLLIVCLSGVERVCPLTSPMTPKDRKDQDQDMVGDARARGWHPSDFLI